MVITMGKGVDGFTLDPDRKEVRDGGGRARGVGTWRCYVRRLPTPPFTLLTPPSPLPSSHLSRWQFLGTHPDMRIPSSGPLVCTNEANFGEYCAPVQHYLRQVKVRC